MPGKPFRRHGYRIHLTITYWNRHNRDRNCLEGLMLLRLRGEIR